MSTAWLLESDMPDADGRILYQSKDHGRMTADPNDARQFPTERDADLYRRNAFPPTKCPLCGHWETDGRSLALHPREHEWPESADTATVRSANEVKP